MVLRTLKARLTLTTTLLTAGLLAAGTVLAVGHLQRDLRQRVARRQRFLVATVAANLDANLRQRRTALAALAPLLSSDTLTHPARIDAFFQDHPDTRSLFGNRLFLFSSSGQLLAASSPPKMLGVDFSSLPIFHRTLQIRRPAISAPLQLLSDKGKPLLLVTAPVFTRGREVIAILAGIVNLQSRSMLGTLPRRIREGEPGIFHLQGPGWSLLLQERNTLSPHRQKAVPEPRNKNMVGEMIRTASRLHTKNWTLVLQLPTADALAPTKKIRRFFFLIVLPAELLLSWLLAWFIVARGTAPLTAFTCHVQELAGKRKKPFVPAAHQQDEIGLLAAAFNEMVAEINAQTESLQEITREVSQYTGDYFFRSLVIYLARELQVDYVVIGEMDKAGSQAVKTVAVWERDGLREDISYFLPDLPSFAGAVGDELARRIREELPSPSSINRLQVDGYMDVPLTDAEGKVIGLLYIMHSAPIPNPQEAETLLKLFAPRTSAELERRQVREVRDQSLSLLQATLESTADGIVVVDLEGRIISFNQRFLEIWHIPREVMEQGAIQIAQHYVLDQLVHPEEFLAGIQELSAHPEREGLDIIHCKDGRVYERVSRPQRIDKRIVGRVSSYHDLTEHRRALEQIRKLSLAVEQSPSTVVITDPRGTIEYVNPRFTEITGYTSQEAIGQNPRVLRGEDTSAEHFADLWATISAGRQWRGEFHNRRKDGSYYWESASISPIKDDAGNISHFIAIKEDISERKQDEEKLRQTLSLLQATLESTADGILVVDRQGRVTLHNKRYSRLSGLPEGGLVGTDHRSLLKQILPRIRNPQESMSEIEALYRHPEAEGTGLVRLKDGRTVERFSCPQRMGETIVGRVWSFRDITAQKDLEQQLSQAQKMEAVGQLAGGVAHDFNNLLTVINGYATLLARALKGDGDRQKDAEVILQAGERASSLTRQLLAFSRRQVLEPRVLQLNELIGNFQKMLRRLIREDIAIELALTETIGLVRADPGQLEQILLNLVVNARDAITGRGKIVISTGEAEFDEAFVQQHPGSQPGHYVMFAVTDSGSGMPAEVLEHIFEPFFTTKEQGRGTGLGLATVYGIVKQSAGYITVDSTPGQGSVFCVYLPLCPPEQEDNRWFSADDAGAAPVSCKGGRILLVEDQPEVLRLAFQTLTKEGFSVLQAASAEKARELFAAEKEMLDLLITDIVMPKVSGIELAAALHETNPRLPVLYMSGYSDLHDQKDFAPPQEQAFFLQKPFPPEGLLQKVREVLARSVQVKG